MTDCDNKARSLTKNPYASEKMRRRMVNVFTFLAIIVTLAVGAVIVSKIAQVVKEQMIEAYVDATASQVRGVIHSSLTLEDLDKPFTGKKYNDYKSFMDRAIERTNVAKVNLWRPDGTVLFSNDAKKVGRRYTGKKSLATALTGETYLEITDLKAKDNEDWHKDYNRMLEIYYPIYLDKEHPEKVSAVYEAYLTLLPLEAHAASVTRSLVIGLFVLSILIIIIAEVASRMMRRQNDMLRRLSSELEVMADTDGLTKLYNHRHFQSYLEKELKRAGRYEKNLSLIMIDLDFFKTINDRFGHQTGDEVLKKVAGTFKEILRDVDYAARYGGEEFVMVLPDTDGQSAVAVAERLRTFAQTLRFGDLDPSATSLKLTLSAGVAEFPNCGSTNESLIAAADSALLFAKRKGRNQVCYLCDPSSADMEEGDLDRLVSRLQHAGIPTIQALVAAVDSKDAYKNSHLKNMMALAQKFSTSMGLEENLAHVLSVAAQVHDVGKVAIPERILGKVEPLSEAEMQAIRAHPETSARIVKTAGEMEALLSAVLHHHENWDGSGYPDGLKGKEIPYLARMLRILDAYEAMLSDRPYRRAMTKNEAFTELRANAGAQFDPELVEKFIAAAKEAAEAEPVEKKQKTAPIKQSGSQPASA